MTKETLNFTRVKFCYHVMFIIIFISMNINITIINNIKLLNIIHIIKYY